MASPLGVGRGLAASAASLASKNDQFADPFMDIASMAFPENIQEAIRWCEFILSKNGPYREALNRVLSYFITDVEIVPLKNKRLGKEEKQKYEDFLNDTLGIKSVLYDIGLDYLGYGNSFTSMLVPFRRYLSCPKCGLELPLRKLANTPQFGFRWSGFDFHANCAHCHYSGAWRHVDRRSGDKKAVQVRRWSPHEIDIWWDEYNHDRTYIWKIPETYRTTIRQQGPQDVKALENASWEVIQAIKANENLQFDNGVVYHMAMSGMAGHNMRGWGLSRVLTNFGQAWLAQMLWRQVEALAADFVNPFRCITPMPRPGAAGESTDPVLSINMGGFVQRVERMLQARRRDPCRWNVLPFPIQYQALGGDANQFAPNELIDLAMTTLLNAIGIPAELYSATLSVQAAPAALRLFEANWAHLVHAFNRFLAHVCERVGQIMSWEPVTARLVRVKHADDLNRQMAILQLMMGGQISKKTGLGTMGLDVIEETYRKLEEQREEAEATQEMQEEMEQSARMDQMAPPVTPAPPGGAPAGDPAAAAAGGGGGAAPPGAGAPLGPMGMPAGPGGAATAFGAMQPPPPGGMVSLDEMQAQASMMAQQAMMMPESQKDSFLIQLSHENEVLHLMVKSQLEQMKKDQKEQAAAQAAEQQKQAEEREFGKRARAITL